MPTPPRPIARQLAVGFGAIAAVAVGLCAFFLLLLSDVSELVCGMRHDESAIRQGQELATAVREQSMRATLALMDPEPRRLARYEADWQALKDRLARIAPLVPAPERSRLALLGEQVENIHALFAATGVATADWPDRLERLTHAASEHADALAVAIEGRMATAHIQAIDTTRLGLLTGAGCILLILALSVGFTVRLRATVLKPLLKLSDAARRIGEGDFGVRVGEVGEGELLALAQGFDRMAEAVAEREARLVQSERMAAIGQLAAGVAHELNNPIGIIRGYLKTMEPDGDRAVLKEELAILDEEAAACQRIAEDLLAYARPPVLAPEVVSGRLFVQEAARRFQESPAGKGAALTVIADDAPLSVDPARLRQVVQNLLTNAAQANPGGPLRLSATPHGDEFWLEVEDQGPGVPLPDRERVFEPFYSKRRGGTGLGLSVCLGIVRTHQGRIEVLEGERGGALFRVVLPLKEAR